MAKFVTYIADPDLESSVIKAIAAINGELTVRGVSLDQIRVAEQAKDITLVCTRQIDFAYKRVIVDKSMTTEEISALLQPELKPVSFEFNSGTARVICFVGLSGGVGTTTLAINFAFEMALKCRVQLCDLDMKNPDVARALGLHRIEERSEKVANNLFAIQGLPSNSDCEALIFDLGSNLRHPLIESADEIYLVTKAGFNTLARLQELDLTPSTLIINFAERTKSQQKWRAQIAELFPRQKVVNIPWDLKAFESAADSKSALMESSPNSLARKSIAILG
jgi:Flp pilus assembly CpaE family ATPase